MEKKGSCLRAGPMTILCGVLAILLCVAPALHADVEVPPANPEINYLVAGSLWVYETANILPGADIELFVYATGTSTVNITGGSVGWWIDVAPGADVTVYGTNFNLGEGTQAINGLVTGTYPNGDLISLEIQCLTGATVTLAAPGGPPQIAIDIKPGSDDNTINLGSNGVIPVAILSSAGFDATALDPDSIFLAGAGVAVRGKGNKYLASEQDVNGDGLVDLEIKVETENLDPGKFQDGKAVLQVFDGTTEIYSGSDTITIVPQ
ncbi:MAG: hypothetical protein JXN61_01395 [Sedimentisphaerales bacterium]|nr:hypothetical protein [Sedimentisphaerales bacterium]